MTFFSKWISGKVLQMLKIMKFKRRQRHISTFFEFYNSQFISSVKRSFFWFRILFLNLNFVFMKRYKYLAKLEFSTFKQSKWNISLVNYNFLFDYWIMKILGNLIYFLGGNIYFWLEIWGKFPSYFVFLITVTVDVLFFSPGNTRFDLFVNWHSNGSLNFSSLLHKFWKSHLFTFVNVPFPITDFKI